jgi:hypothetical protein
VDYCQDVFVTFDLHPQTIYLVGKKWCWDGLMGESFDCYRKTWYNFG